MRSLSIIVACMGLLACHRAEQSQPAEPNGRVATSSESPKTIAAPRLSARLLDHAGQPLAAAHLTVRRPNHKLPLFDAELDGGRVELELPAPGAYFVELAGVDHQHQSLRLFVEEEGAELDAWLGTYARKQVGDTLSVRARWIDGEGTPGEPFVAEAVRPTSSGIHELKLDVPERAEALQYQLVGVHERTFNGPGGQRWEYDGGGDYWAEVSLGDRDRLELGLDLDALPSADRKSKIELRGATSYPWLAANRLLGRYWKQIGARMDEHAELADRDEATRLVGAAVAEIAAEARTAVEAVDKPRLAKAAALEWLTMFGQFARLDMLDVEALTWVFEFVPPDDPSWAFFAGRITSMFYELDAPPIAAEVAALREQQREPGVLAELLFVDLTLANKRGDQTAVAELYAELAASYPETHTAFLAASRFDPSRPLQPGKPMPEWSFPSLDGSSRISSAELTGQPYLIDIWSSWCSPCVNEMPALHDAYAAINENRSTPAVEFVGLSMDASADAVAKLREQWPMPWLHALVPDAEQQALHERWGFAGIPTVVLVDAEGNIVAVNEALRGEQLLPTLRAFVAR